MSGPCSCCFPFPFLRELNFENMVGVGGIRRRSGEGRKGRREESGLAVGQT